MSIINRTTIASHEDTNLVSMKAELMAKLQELSPVVAFYDEIRSGWFHRTRLAVTALEQIPDTDRRNQEILTELKNIAIRESEASLNTFNTVDNIKKSIEQKIQDLNLYALKGITSSITNPALDGTDDIRRLLHQADALLELRSSEQKGISS